MNNILSFKPQFRLADGRIANSNHNIGGGLLPIFDWKLDFEKNEI
jgi:hypothetical protein